MTIRVENPFTLVTASKLSASEAVALWCDDKRLDRITGRETCFIHGHRGTGKSMLFRVLQRDCQVLLSPDEEPSFLAVYFSVRDSDFLIEELKHFDSDLQRYIICESQLSLLIAKQLFLIIGRSPEVVPEDARESLIDLVVKRMSAAYRFSETAMPLIDRTSFCKAIANLIDVIEEEGQGIRHFIFKRLYASPASYDGPLFLYDALLGPMADFFYDHCGVCLYFLIDDGDDLPEAHTVILNTWIARRRASAAFKVSTMYAYKTWETRSGSAIQPAHDYVQYDIATRYLDGKGESYVQLLKEICRKRLDRAGVRTSVGAPVDPTAFFPKHELQEEKIGKVRERLMEEYAMKFTGRAIRDNVYRHTTSEYMRELNRGKSLGSYCYAGFDTLAILSGGLVRDFIVCAQVMFDNASREMDGAIVESVSPAIQNQAVRAHADKLLEEVGDARQKRVRDPSEWQKVGKLVEGLGSLFKTKILSQDSERRVFSFALQRPPSERLGRVLMLAMSEGYLMRGYIARKEGTGRRALYVLTRRLAPCFSLDVSSYSGYLSCTPEDIERLAHGGTRVTLADMSSAQLELFEDERGGAEFGWVDPDDVEVC